MKIKGPANYSGPPTPPDLKTDKGKSVAGFDPQKGAETPQSARAKGKAQEPASFEKSLSQIAKAIKAEGLQGEAMASKVVDSVLDEIFGKDFLSKPGAAAMRKTLSPFLSQDETVMNKLNNVLSRLEKKTGST